jgi:hypothetical protein
VPATVDGAWCRVARWYGAGPRANPRRKASDGPVGPGLQVENEVGVLENSRDPSPGAAACTPSSAASAQDASIVPVNGVECATTNGLGVSCAGFCASVDDAARAGTHRSDRDANEPVDREWTLVELENAYLRVVVLRRLRTRRSRERPRATITRPLRLKP